MQFLLSKIWLKIKARNEKKKKKKRKMELRTERKAELKEQHRLELKRQRKAELKRQRKAELKRQHKAELREQQQLGLIAQDKVKIEAEQKREKKIFNSKAELKEQHRLELKRQRKAELKRQRKAELKRQHKAELRKQQQLRLIAQDKAKIKAEQKREKKILNKVLENKAFILWMLSFPPHIVKGFRDVPSFNLNYWLNMLESWHKHRYTIADPYPCMDVLEECLTIQNGQRRTVGQPKQASNTIYMLGSYMAFGMYVLDSQTSSSVLQRQCELIFPSRYKVVNLGFAANNIWVDLLKFNNLHLNPGDFVILQVDGNQFAAQMVNHCDLLISINRKCQHCSVKFIILVIPGANQILNPSRIERELSCLTYQQLVSGGSDVSAVDKSVRVWTRLPLLTELQRRGCLVEDMTPYFARPHRMGEVFMDKQHMLPSAYEEISRVIFEKYIDDRHGSLQTPVLKSNLIECEIDLNGTMFFDCENFYYPTSQVLIAQNRIAEARELLENALIKYPSSKIVAQSLRLSFFIGDYAWCTQLFAYAEEMGMEIAVANKRRFLLGAKRIKEAYATYRQESRPYMSILGARYVKNIEDIKTRGNRVFIFANGGPGDEIRFIQLYPLFSRILSDHSLCFACDLRLLGLLERSYPLISFHPSQRAIRGFSLIDDFLQYNRLPNLRLSVVFDNESWGVAMESDSVVDCLDLLGDVLNGYESFEGKPYLKADPIRVADMQQRFMHIKKPLVGISWRSSLVNYNRIEHYFSIDEIMNLFAQEDIQFVNLQYDVHAWEIEKVECKYPGRLLHLSDIDQCNDFESTAALMECMDLIIAPATTVIELAGALGRPAWLLSNSAELHWRKNPLNNDRDVWHHSVVHVEGCIGDKSTLIESLISKLSLWKKERVFPGSELL